MQNTPCQGKRQQKIHFETRSVWKLSCTLIKTAAPRKTTACPSWKPALSEFFLLTLVKQAPRILHLNQHSSNSHSRYADLFDVKRQQHFFAFRSNVMHDVFLLFSSHIEAHGMRNDRNDLEICRDWLHETRLGSLNWSDFSSPIACTRRMHSNRSRSRRCDTTVRIRGTLSSIDSNETIEPFWRGFD